MVQPLPMNPINLSPIFTIGRLITIVCLIPNFNLPNWETQTITTTNGTGTRCQKQMAYPSYLPRILILAAAIFGWLPGARLSSTKTEILWAWQQQILHFRKFSKPSVK